MASELPKLNFPPLRLRCIKRNGEISVWDDLRRCYLVLTPEEWVRRHTIGWLISLGIPPQRIAQEHPVNIEGQPQRSDIVVFDNTLAPLLLVECKAASIPLTAETFNQAVRYNSILHAPHLMLTNGLEHRFYNFDGENYTPIPNLEL